MTKVDTLPAAVMATALGGMDSDVAAYAGISRSTLQRWKRWGKEGRAPYTALITAHDIAAEWWLARLVDMDQHGPKGTWYPSHIAAHEERLRAATERRDARLQELLASLGGAPWVLVGHAPRVFGRQAYALRAEITALSDEDLVALAADLQIDVSGESALSGRPDRT